MVNPKLTIPAALLATSMEHGNSLALAWNNQLYSYSQLTERILRAGAVLRKLGMKKGDRLAIWLPNSGAYIEAALGAMFIGSMAVPINTRLKPKEAEYILKTSGARWAIAASDFLGTNFASQIKQLILPTLEGVIHADIDGAEGEWDRALAAITSEEIEETLAQAQAILPDDPAEVIFTSGTTGFPKGAVLTHGQIVRAYQFYGTRAGIELDDRYLIIAPMFHSFGFKAGVIVSLIHGAAIYPMAAFDAAEALKIIDEEKITVMGGPPTIFSSLLDHKQAEGRDISSLRSIVLGGSMISPDLVRTLREEVGVETVLSAYGLTETTALVTMARAEDGVELISTTAGQVVEGMEMRCVDADGKEAKFGEPGEIEARGGNIMVGYFEDPVRTAENMTKDGWFKTGDIGIIDNNGYLTLTDRKKDMFIVGGFNCYPAEIEAIVIEHPLVLDVAVIGVSDERMGDVAKAYVVPKKGKTIDPETFILWCRENMANFKVPRFVEVVDTLPRNAMGKIQKFRLRDPSKKS